MKGWHRFLLHRLMPFPTHWGLTIILWASVVQGRDAEGMKYIYNAPESRRDVRYQYQWEILRTALDKTKGKHGIYQMEAAEFMTEKRQAYELQHATGELTVMYLGTTPEFERTLVPVRIPVDRNLGGYRIFLIRKQDQMRFDRAVSLDDLRRFRYGLGLGWVDVGILRSNRFDVVTGSSYDGLFEMLSHGRFDVFLRGAVEVLDEFDQHKALLPDLGIEQGLVLAYCLPMYFWFSQTEEGRRLARRVEEGMWQMIEDGTYKAIFERYQRPKIERLKLANRRLLRIDNPLLGPETPLSDKRLWFDPSSDQ